MWEIFERLLKERNLKVSDVAQATGINNAFFTDWKKGRKKDITTGNAFKIAEFLGVNVEYLITGKDTQFQYDKVLPSDAALILDLYSKLSDEDKNTIKALLNTLSNK